MIGNEAAAAFSIQGASETTSIWHPLLSVISRYFSTTNADEDGVRFGDWLAASREEPMEDGEAVPSFEASLFFLDDLFGSFPRESCRE